MSFLSQENKSNNNINDINDFSNKNNDNNNSSNIIKSIKDKYKLIPKFHPLEFYALGKINNNSNKNSSTFYNSSSLSSPRLRVNNSSHSLFDRNLLSVNNSFFENLKQVKNNTSLNYLNKNENNYLNPLLVYKIRINEKKENQKRNNINSLEWLNIIKNKLFSIDINSKIQNGKNISRNQFYEQKNKLIPKTIKDNSMDNDNLNHNNTSYQFENKNNLSDGYDHNFTPNGSIENILSCKRFKKENEKLNKLRKIIRKDDIYNDYWKKLRIEKSRSTDELISKDFKKYDEKKLKSNVLYFDKNYQNFIRHRNWWKINP